MKSNFLVLSMLIALSTSSSFAQSLWPFRLSDGTVQQGRITGVPGEFRTWGVNSRFHAGVDLKSQVPGPGTPVYSMHAGTAVVVYNAQCLATYIRVDLANGDHVYYKHIVPASQDPITGITAPPIADGNPVVVGTFLGVMTTAGGCEQHVHINQNNVAVTEANARLVGTTNILTCALSPFTDNREPEFMYPFNAAGAPVTDNSAVEFRANGHTYTNSTAQLSSTVTQNSTQYKVIYDKVDVLTRLRDRHIEVDGTGSTGDNGINTAGFQLIGTNNTPVGPLFEFVNFTTIPPLERANFIFDSRSLLQSGLTTRHVYILTSSTGVAPYDRFLNTRLRVGQFEDWDLTNRNGKDARSNDESFYKDGTYRMFLQAGDIRNQNGTESNTAQAAADVLIDNFLPYVKDVTITKTTGRPVYRGSWVWDSNTGVLSLSATTGDAVNNSDNILITISTSEPVQNLQINIPSTDYTLYRTMNAVAGTNNTKFTINYGSIAQTGVQTINLQAADFAGNLIQSDPSMIAIRQPNGSWGPGANPGIDSKHKFNTGSDVCGPGGFPGGRIINGPVASNANAGCVYSDFTVSSSNPSVNELVTYTPIAAGNGLLTYTWNFGAGATPSTSTSSGPQSVIYSTSGPKTVSLKICDNSTTCATELKTNILNVGVPVSELQVDFSGTPSLRYVSQTIQLSSTVTGGIPPYSYTWSFGPGLFSGSTSDANPLISYNTVGFKTLSVTVTDASGATASKVKNNFISIISSDYDISVNVGGCITTGVDGNANVSAAVFGGVGTGYTSYLWDFGDGTSSTVSSTSVNHHFPKPGKYTIRLTVCDQVSCGTGTAVNCVTVPNGGPGTLVPDFLVNNVALSPPSYTPVQVGLNTPVTFVDASTGMTGTGSNPTWSWDFDFNVTQKTATPWSSNVQGPVEVYYTTTGNKDVKLGVAAFSSSNSIVKVAAVNVSTGKGKGRCVAILNTPTVSSSCWTAANPPTFSVTTSSTNCPVAKTEVIYWNSPGSGLVLPGNKLNFAAMGLPVPAFPFTADFSFAVYQYDGLNYNQIGYRRQRFTIYGPTTSNAGPDIQVCTGSSATIGLTNTDSRSYKWTAIGTTPISSLSSTSVSNPVFAGVQRGAYNYRLTTTDNISGCSGTDDVIITVDKPEIANIGYSIPPNTSQLLSPVFTNGFGSNQYSWTPATNLSAANVANPTFSSVSSGVFNFSVSVTDVKGCTAAGQVYVDAANSPGALTATAASFNRVQLDWIDRSSNETGFVIQRSVNDNTNFTDLQTIGPNSTTFSDLAISPGTNYFYQVAALLPGPVRLYSNVVTVNTGSLPLFTRKALAGSMVGSMGDLDNDLDLDFFSSSTGVLDFSRNGQINMNNNGTLVPGIVNTYWGSIGSTIADFDNDGDLDILVGNQDGTAVMLKNSNGTFTVVSQTITSYMSTPFDYDNDNDVDIVDGPFVTAAPRYPFIYQNQGAYFNTMSPITSGCCPPIEFTSSKTIKAADFDNDGTQDLFFPVLGKIYKNAFNHFQDQLFTAMPNGGNYNGVDVGDSDRDGDFDIVMHPTFLNPSVFSNLGNSGFQETVLGGNTKDRQPYVSFGDMDGDGDLDLLASVLNGYSGGNKTLIYENINGIFSVAFTNIAASAGADSMYDWIDIDNDGDLDISTSSGGYIFLNNRGTNQYKPNTKPQAPANPCAYLSGDNLVMSWDPGSDLETPSAGLSYNVYVKNNGQFIMSPLADLTTGFRKIPARGNVDENRKWKLKVASASNLEWGVQSIDNQMIGSSFATVLPTITTSNLCGSYTGVQQFSANIIKAPANCPANTVTIQSGANVTLSASNTVSLLPGFTIKPGAVVSIKTFDNTSVPGPCLNGSKTEVITGDIKNSETKLDLYPNPTTGILFIKAAFETAQQQVVVNVYSVTGALMYSRAYERVSEIGDQLDLSGLMQGIYIVRVQTDQKIYVDKIIRN